MAFNLTFDSVKTSIKKLNKTIVFAFQNAWSFDKSYLILKTLKIFPNILNSIIIITIPRLIIDTLQSRLIVYPIAYTAIFILWTILFTLLSSLMNNKMNIKTIRLDRKLSEKLLSSVLKMDYEKFESSNTLDKFAHAKTCISEASITDIIDKVFGIIESVLTTFAYLYILFKYSLLFVPIIFITIFISAACQNKKDSEYFTIQEQSENTNRKVAYASNNLTDYSFAKETRVFRLKDYILDKYNFYVNLMYKLEFKYIKKVTPIEIIVALSDAVRIFAVYGCVSYSLWKNEISVGAFTQYISSFLALSGVINSVTSSVVNLKNKQKYIDCYKAFTENTADRRGENGENNQKKKDVGFDFEFKEIEFKNVSYKYPNSDRFILKNINLKITSLDRVALVGKNGAGKTTIVKLLLRLYDVDKGEITVNGINIMDIRYDDYIKLMSPVFQDVKLFAYSVKENIILNKAFDSDRMNGSLDAIGIRGQIENTPRGIETCNTKEFDESGINFSGGEIQKIAIARALYQGGEVLIMDEPNSALDSLSERDLINNIKLISKDKMSIFISHRLSLSKTCDKIIVMNNGEVEEIGSHRELLKSHGLYYSLFSMQASKYTDSEQ